MSSIELHIIQNFPPSNLNRDDIGQPKSTDFGGVRRARISSQCQKRAIRLHPVFAKATGVEPSERTGMIIRGLVRHLLVKHGVSAAEADAESLTKPIETTIHDLPILKKQVIQVANCLAEEYAKKPLDEDKTPTLIYLSSDEMQTLANQAFQSWERMLASAEAVAVAKLALKNAGSDKKKKADAQKSLDEASKPFQDMVKELLKQTKERTNAPDIALYGRMLADRPETNIDAACQVAHAISTHKVRKADIDYYTAMDDVKQRMKDPGAGFLDVAYFNSACFYRYMRIDFALLEKTLGDHDLAVKTVEGFMRAAEAAIPSGKQNSHAQFTRPSFMLAVLRPDGSDGWNLVNAFAQPIGVAENDEQGLIKKSVHALEDKFDHHCKFYGEGAVNTIAVALPDGTITQSDLSKRLADAIKSMDEWVKTMTDGLGK